jgi:hypothetical protein
MPESNGVPKSLLFSAKIQLLIYTSRHGKARIPKHAEPA